MSSANIPKLKNFLNKFKDFLISRLNLLLVLLLIWYCYLSYRDDGFDISKWDMMFISGVLVFIIAAYMSQTLPSKMHQTITRLAARRSLKLSDDVLKDLTTKIIIRSNHFSSIFSIIVALVIFIIFLMAGERAETDILRDKLGLTIFEVFLGFVAGHYVGQMVAFGTLGNMLIAEKIDVLATPGHIDQAAGLKPIGTFYFFQAMILALPCLFLAVWWYVIPIYPLSYPLSYEPWRDSYLLLLIVALFLEILSFVLPMWVFHSIMRRQKNKYLQEADSLSEEIIKLEEDILNTSDSKSVQDIQRHLDFLREKYWQIENMPTWPVDASIRRKFTVNNALLFTPFLFDMVKSVTLRTFLDALVEVLTD